MPKVGLGKVSTLALKKELDKRLAALPTLIAQRDELNRRIAELGALSAVEEAPKPAPPAATPKKQVRRRTQAKNPMSLAAALAEVIQREESMSIPEAAKAVLASGYKTNCKDFPNLVSLTLSKDKRFERVDRGVYKVRA